MRLSQMWPSKWLEAPDLASLCPQGCVITIEGVDVTWYTNEKGEPEPVYMLFTTQFKKPIRLNKTNGWAVNDLLHTEETDEWIGKNIRVRPLEKTFFDRSTKRNKLAWVIDVDIHPVGMAPAMPGVKRDITGIGSRSPVRPQLQPHSAATQQPPTDNLGELGPIGEDKAGQVVAAFRERAQTEATFLVHLKGMGIDSLIANKIPPQWPRAILAPALKFAQGFPKTVAPMTPTAIDALKATWRPAASQDVIDTQTGAVIKKGEPLPGSEPTFEPILEEDIPF